ncbi:anti-sigma regulatory factor [Lentisphaera marina]|uniref:anti-sigma regulatory factor n=1 Tax=Lentisphaera marina TaxID=1111041 RepID=UPI002365CCEB|nr:anti-sigma regulatory factor [Lentisphaera marina]MDD7984288.1 anti-sigma regulatory factor [Lentisphaera marina]
MQNFNCYIYDDVSVSTGIIEAREWLGESVVDHHVKSLLLTVFAELAQNIIKYANRGKILLEMTKFEGEECLMICSKDHGPGIEDIEKALSENFSTSGTLGLGLPGVKRIMDEFQIDSKLGEGTTIRTFKYL